MNIPSLFPTSYEASRIRFRENLSIIQEKWANAELHHHALAYHPDLTVDWIQADATKHPEKLMILSIGEHGAEGIVGSAMMQLFIEEYLPHLNPENTGILLVHAINPWGMKSMRRVNPNNVDLNRNFLAGEKAYVSSKNEGYALINAFLNPQESVKGRFIANLVLFSKLVKNMIAPGEAAIRAGTLMGQFEFPQGLYFGGQQLEEETQLMMSLYRKTIQKYAHILHLDMHTGYGPRYQMSLVNSPLETRGSKELEELFAYPRIVAATPDEFYTMQGDMIDWMYKLVRSEFPEKKLYATAFEFGTFGDSLFAGIRSLKAMIFENQLHWHGASNQNVEKEVKEDFRELFAPTKLAWQEKATADVRSAFSGILKAEKF